VRYWLRKIFYKLLTARNLHALYIVKQFAEGYLIELGELVNTIVAYQSFTNKEYHVRLIHVDEL
jgi:hypothetical protein